MAIIAILAAIAIPNFLEAQTRSKVSRVHSDFRTLATAIEAYAVDYSEYPIEPPRGGDVGRGPIGTCIQLTTPVPYITSVGLRDPFRLNDSSGSMGEQHAIGGDWISYGYVNLPKASGSGRQYATINPLHGTKQNSGRQSFAPPSAWEDAVLLLEATQSR